MEQNNTNATCCSVCLEATETRVNPCQHLLCLSCFHSLRQWRKSCPLCRAGPITMPGFEQSVAEVNPLGMRSFVYQMYQQNMRQCPQPPPLPHERLIDRGIDLDYWLMMEELCCNPNPQAQKLIPDWVKKRNQFRLSKNPAAIEYLKANPDCICWNALAQNPHPEAIQMAKEYYRQREEECAAEIVYCYETTRQTRSRQHEQRLEEEHQKQKAIELKHLILDVCKNPSQGAMHWLCELTQTRSIDKLMVNMFAVDSLLSNPAAIETVERYFHQYNEQFNSKLVNNRCYHLVQNPSAMHLILQMLNQGNDNESVYIALSQNPAAMSFLLLPENQDKIDYGNLIFNPHPDAMQWIETHLDQIDPDDEDNNIDLDRVFSNPAIFTDYVWRPIGYSSC